MADQWVEHWDNQRADRKEIQRVVLRERQWAE